MTTPLDQFPEFAAAYKHVPEPAPVWNFASIDDAYRKMSRWNFFLYALVTYAHSMTAKIEKKSESAIDVSVKKAAATIKTDTLFKEVKKNTEDMAKILKKNRPIQDPYFMKTVLLRQNKAITSNLQDLLQQADAEINAYLGFFPLAQTLYLQIKALVASFSKSTKSYGERIANEEKGYHALFLEDPTSLQQKMQSVTTIAAFRQQYFPRTTAEDATGEPLIQFLHSSLDELWAHQQDIKSIRLLLQAVRSHLNHG